MADMPTFLRLSPNERRVPGLRDFELPCDVFVYKMTPEGKRGEFLRVEKGYYPPTNNKRTFGLYR